jgi:hypothetical protein
MMMIDFQCPSPAPSPAVLSLWMAAVVILFVLLVIASINLYRAERAWSGIRNAGLLSDLSPFAQKYMLCFVKARRVRAGDIGHLVRSKENHGSY